MTAKQIVIDIDDLLDRAADEGDCAGLIAALEGYRARGFAIVLAGGVAEGPDHLALDLANGADPERFARTIATLEAAGLSGDSYSVRGVHIGPDDFVIDDKAVTVDEFVESEPEALAALLAKEDVAR